VGPGAAGHSLCIVDPRRVRLRGGSPNEQEVHVKPVRWTTRTRRIVAVAAMAVVLALVAAVAFAATAPAPAIQTSTPTSERQITNIDVLRQQIRNYYGDPLGTGTFAADGNYAKEAQSVAARGERYLAKRVSKGKDAKAIILDVDDTTLATWNYEIASNWAFNPTTNGAFVTEQRFPAVPGMVDLVQKAAQQGYAIIFLTGRPGRGLPRPDDAQRRRGRPVHQAGPRRLPRLPEDRLRRRDRRGQGLHHDPLQVGDPGAHREPGL
jgi:hypothetical protein